MIHSSKLARGQITNIEILKVRQKLPSWLITIALLCAPPSMHAKDPYATYIRTAPEFEAVNQDTQMLIQNWDTWRYMPWRYQWTIGTGEAASKFVQKYHFNGGFIDHCDGPFKWLKENKLSFYCDHAAGKGTLLLRKGNWKPDMLNNMPNKIRYGNEGQKPLNDATIDILVSIMEKNLGNIKKSVFPKGLLAYALDDEVSWGSFIKPITWRTYEDKADYAAYLKKVYGENNAPEPQFVGPEFTRAQLGQKLSALDFSPFLDRMTFNDSHWANFIGRLVDAGNQIAPRIPAGIVGAQSPNLFGGFDYAKLMKKVQFIEAYDLGSAQEIIRSFNPNNAIPVVTTHFHKKNRIGTAKDIWQFWYYFAHGNRGTIGWVENWFNGETPQAWLAGIKEVNKELGDVQGHKLVGSKWIHDGIAIYYSHPSVQVSWILDAQPHKSSWINRDNDYLLGTSHLVRKAWEYLISDSGLQYNYIPYDEVIRAGIPKEYKVVILPATYALSDAEAAQFNKFVMAGGTLIADFAPGIFDQHGRGRSKGALDDLFGIKHSGNETAKDFFGDVVFGDSLWVETNQDKGYNYKKYSDLLDTIDCKIKDGFAVAETKLPIHTLKVVGRGQAVLVNQSPMRYLQYREERRTTDAQRNVFMQYINNAGVKPRLSIENASGNRPTNIEATYWIKGNRIFYFIIQNPETGGRSLGGDRVKGLRQGFEKIRITFPRPLYNVINERTGEKRTQANSLDFDFNIVEAILFSAQKPDDM